MERYRGFCTGFAPGEAKMLVVPTKKDQRQTFYQEHLQEFHRGSAVFAVSDYYAIELIHFLTEQGFSIPRDISIAGFDDTPMCEMAHPTLTTVRQDGALRAKTAIEKLRELRKNTLNGTEIRLPVFLVVRNSTGKRTK